MNFLDEFKCSILEYADKHDLSETTKKQYAEFSYFKHIKLMKFTTRQFEIEGFGNLMFMHTNAMGGLMKLLTVSFMPNSGIEMPYLLIDLMSMKKKKACFVEYYDCTGKSLSFEALQKIRQKYSDVPEYDEKPAWYIKERMPESLIKGGKVESVPKAEKLEQQLLTLVNDSFAAYMSLISDAKIDLSCLLGLQKFKERMQKEGNPSDATMRRVLGEEGAKQFFDEYVMPMKSAK